MARQQLGPRKKVPRPSKDEVAKTPRRKRARASDNTERKTCGDFGGMKRGRRHDEPTPCNAWAGAGTEHIGTGRCVKHDEQAEAAKAALKEEVLTYLRDPNQTLANVSQLSGVSITRMWDWKAEDEAFDKEWITIQANKDRQRVAIVEDALFVRAAAGKINPAEAIFFLKNRDPARWKDKVERELTGKDGTPLIPIEALRLVLSEEDEDE